MRPLVFALALAFSSTASGAAYPAPGYYMIDDYNTVTITRISADASRWAVEIRTGDAFFSCGYKGEAQIVFGSVLVSQANACTVMISKSSRYTIGINTQGDCELYCAAGSPAILDVHGFKKVKAE